MGRCGHGIGFKEGKEDGFGIGRLGHRTVKEGFNRGGNSRVEVRRGSLGGSGCKSVTVLGLGWGKGVHGGVTPERQNRIGIKVMENEDKQGLHGWDVRLSPL